MITLTGFSGKAAGVFGLGKAGEAAAAALLAGGAQVYAWDDGEAARDALRKKLKAAKLLPLAQWPWEALACMALSPGVPLAHPAVHLARKAGVPVAGDAELLYQAQPEAVYVGITGTNGKSTTTTLVAHILKAAGRRVEAGGNLGTPALALAPLSSPQAAGGEPGIYVLEMSSYQLDLLHRMRFRVAALLNVTPDHLDRHGDMQGYLAAKLHIFERQQAGDTAVVAVDDGYTEEVAGGRLQAAGNGAALVRVSAQKALEKGVYVQDGRLFDTACGTPSATRGYDLSSIPALTGRHNWQNAAAAWAVCRSLGVEAEAIHAAMRTFPGLAHRMEPVAEIGGVRFVNDSKATNAEAAANALAAYETVYWILGGKAKEGGIGALEGYFPKIAHAFLIGAAAKEFARALEGKAPYTQCGTLDVAVQHAAEMAWKEGAKGAVVLLSPACASFDQFKNFEERGEAFRALVGALPRSGTHAP